MELGGITAQAGQQDFLQLLVTQLQNQDPLSPVEQDEMLAQLAQFSTLEQLETLNSSFEEMLQLNQLTEGSQLLGQTVRYQGPTDAEPLEGTVTAIRSNNGIELTVNDTSVVLSDVIELISA